MMTDDRDGYRTFFFTWCIAFNNEGHKKFDYSTNLVYLHTTYLLGTYLMFIHRKFR